MQKPSLADAPDVMTPREVAGVLGIGRDAAYQGVRTGEIPSRRVGHRYLVPKLALERWLRDTEAMVR